VVAFSPTGPEVNRCSQPHKPELTLSQDVDDGFRVLQPPRPQLMLPMNPYVKDVELTLCGVSEEQEQSRLLIAELMANEVAAANIETLSIKYSCIVRGGRDCRCSDSLGTFVELIDRGGSYLKALGHVKWIYCHIPRVWGSDGKD
jgi:hypothetical protein